MLPPLHRGLFTLNPTAFFVPSFLQAINSNNEDGFRSIMTEPAPGLYVFAMLQPAFCQMIWAEAVHFDHWARASGRNRRPATYMDHRSVALSDFGLETMLDNLMKDFISPVAAVLYPELAASPLDSHYSFVTQFAEGEVEGFHVDDSEVTLNVCITREFTGGEMGTSSLIEMMYPTAAVRSDLGSSMLHLPTQWRLTQSAVNELAFLDA
ncbi:hypothetical protein EJB05_31147, partial [Eragrostis curvula]